MSNETNLCRHKMMYICVQSQQHIVTDNAMCEHRNTQEKSCTVRCVNIGTKND